MRRTAMLQLSITFSTYREETSAPNGSPGLWHTPTSSRLVFTAASGQTNRPRALLFKGTSLIQGRLHASDFSGLFALDAQLSGAWRKRLQDVGGIWEPEMDGEGARLRDAFEHILIGRSMTSVVKVARQNERMRRQRVEGTSIESDTTRHDRATAAGRLLVAHGADGDARASVCDNWRRRNNSLTTGWVPSGRKRRVQSAHEGRTQLACSYAIACS
ncbi:hypothetical protein PYCCODRAFT_1426069 [Trametes coccinea BRFM310]|uniref:Uncharacterized protein n=1 Tax=Trametes coccinea (strain BRFM310) TaxID=1353009 RepID=A0A1Y2IJM1_TRAC3|nr:hypothetical protein PYCCODRAFT_1426069 [Trametes coccinea BRFM310]